MLKIHHAPQSRSMRVLWLAEELAIPYEIVPHTLFTDDDLKTREYLRIHPLGKVPAIEDEGLVLWETAPILQYLVARYSDGALCPPPETPEGARQLQWLVFGESQLTLTMAEIAAHGSEVMPDEMRIPALVERGKELAPSLVRIIERNLEPGPFILGEAFSAADIMLGFGLMIAGHLGYLGDEAPKTRAYCEALMARPAYQRAAAL